MGQCYSVNVKLKFKDNDPASFCEIIRNEINARNNNTARFDLSRGSLDDPRGCFMILTAKDIYEDENGWHADFDASYGWEPVLVEIFEKAAHVLDEGSCIEICPDDAVHSIKVCNGEVVCEYIDYVEFDEEDEE